MRLLLFGIAHVPSIPGLDSKSFLQLHWESGSSCCDIWEGWGILSGKVLSGIKIGANLCGFWGIDIFSKNHIRLALAGWLNDNWNFSMDYLIAIAWFLSALAMIRRLSANFNDLHCWKAHPRKKKKRKGTNFKS